jgi:putative membrane protein
MEPSIEPGTPPCADSDAQPQASAPREPSTDTANASRGSSATRDHLANERTLLAWSRTGIAIMGLGFVVARFGLLVRELGGRPSHPLPPGTTNAFGVALVLCGAALLLLALLRYLRGGRAIDEGTYRWSPLLGILLAGSLLLAAMLLAVYLLVTA